MSTLEEKNLRLAQRENRGVKLRTILGEASDEVGRVGRGIVKAATSKSAVQRVKRLPALSFRPPSLKEFVPRPVNKLQGPTGIFEERSRFFALQQQESQYYNRGNILKSARR